MPNPTNLKNHPLVVRDLMFITFAANLHARRQSHPWGQEKKNAINSEEFLQRFHLDDREVDGREE
jgi:hypothetical protein